MRIIKLAMKINHINYYLDGGSALIGTDSGDFFVDRSIGNDSPGTLWSDENNSESRGKYKPMLLDALRNMPQDDDAIATLIKDIENSSD